MCATSRLSKERRGPVQRRGEPMRSDSQEGGRGYKYSDRQDDAGDRERKWGGEKGKEEGKRSKGGIGCN